VCVWALASPGSLFLSNCVLGQGTLLLQYPPRCMSGYWNPEITSGRLSYHPGGVMIIHVTSYGRNWREAQPDKPSKACSHRFTCTLVPRTSALRCEILVSLCLKVAPYSLTIARAPRTKAQVICPRSRENVGVFRYFMTSTRAQKAKLTVNFLAFPSVKFRKIWQTCSQYFILVGARFSGKTIRPVFSQW